MLCKICVTYERNVLVNGCLCKQFSLICYGYIQAYVCMYVRERTLYLYTFLHFIIAVFNKKLILNYIVYCIIKCKLIANHSTS